MGFIHQTIFYTTRSALSIYLFLILITGQSTTIVAATNLPEIVPIGLDTHQILISLESPEQQQQQQQISHGSGHLLGEKRSWQSLQGSWGKRGDYPGPGEDYYTNQLLSVNGDDIHDYAEDSTAPRYAIQFPTAEDERYFNEQKRGWKSMNAAWGKRFSNRGIDMNKYRGTSKSSWGKREPGWDKLKGLWGKRSIQWTEN